MNTIKMNLDLMVCITETNVYENIKENVKELTTESSEEEKSTTL